MRWLSRLFARRYLLARKSHSVINIISGVSAFAVGVPVAALVILLSVFNGFGELVRSMYRTFDPDIAVTAAEGKVFDAVSLDTARLRGLKEVEALSAVLEDNGLLEYRGRQYIGTVRGVDSLYPQVIPVEKMIVDGEYDLMFGDMEQAVVGQGLAYNMGSRRALYDPIRVYAPRRGASFSSLLPMESYRQDRIFPAGTFALEAETDNKYVIAPISFTRRLFDYPDKLSAVMIRLTPGTDPDRARDAIARAAGDGFRVLTREQQKASLYRIMVYEKWGVFLIGLLVLVIASFSVVGSVIMLVIEKQKDIRTLVTLGADIPFLRGIFVREGMLISLVGAAGGLVAGLAFCILQQQLGFIRIPAETFLVDAYPVVIQPGDIAGIAATVLLVNYLITKCTAVRMIPRSALTS